MTAANTHVESMADSAAERESALAAGGAPRRAGEWQQALRRRMALTDGLAAFAGMVSVLLLPSAGLSGDSAGQKAAFGAAGIVALATWLVALDRTRKRRAVEWTSSGSQFRSAILAGAGTLAAACVVIAVSGVSVPRTVLLMPFAVGTALVVAGRAFWHGWLVRQRRRGRCRRSVLVVGDSDRLCEIAGVLSRVGSGVRLVGACLANPSDVSEITCPPARPTDAPVVAVPVFGSASRAAEIAAALGVDAVVVVPSSHMDREYLKRLSWSVDEIGVGLTVASPLGDVGAARVRTERIGLATLQHVARPAYRGASKAAKRAFDVVVGAALLLVAAIPMAAIAMTVRLGSPGPALFLQERVGQGGRRFTMLKFRSMTQDAESRIPDLRAQQDAGNVVMFKMRQDPRVTGVGRFLRRVSLDELPQLVNVLRGEMSLVGPRPPLPGELDQYDDIAQRRFLVKPGMTGLWQVSGRSDLSWDETVRCDRSYVENWTLRGDMSILVRTAGALRKGAY